MFFIRSSRLALSLPRVTLGTAESLSRFFSSSLRYLNTPSSIPPSALTEKATLAALTPTRTHIQFTCKICQQVNLKSMSKKAYTTGLVIIKCDGCASNHLIADHIGWYDSQKPPGTIEDIMEAQGKSDEVTRLCLEEGVDRAAVEGLLEISGPVKKIE